MRRIASVLVAVTALMGVLAACSDGDAALPSPEVAAAAPATTTTLATTTTTLAPTTSTTSTTTSTTTTTTTTLAPTTTSAPTTTLAALPVPEPAPIEDGSTDPVQELGTIEIPKIGLTRSMFEGIRLATLNNGPGHWPGTAMPGEVGNAVIAGHRVSHNKDFRNVDQLVAGDEVIITTETGVHTYHVTGVEVVAPDAIWIVDQTQTATATLFACHPPGSTRERIVVHLQLAA